MFFENLDELESEFTSSVYSLNVLLDELAVVIMNSYINHVESISLELRRESNHELL